MDCVKCEGKLRPVSVDGVVVDQCDACAGIWFDSGELSRVLEMKRVEGLRTRDKSSEADDAKRGKCPRCRGEGDLVQVASLTSDIHIDTCAVCGGKWLDGGELSIVREEGRLQKVMSLLRRLLSV